MVGLKLCTKGVIYFISKNIFFVFLNASLSSSFEEISEVSWGCCGLKSRASSDKAIDLTRVSALCSSFSLHVDRDEHIGTLIKCLSVSIDVARKV